MEPTSRAHPTEEGAPHPPKTSSVRLRNHHVPVEYDVSLTVSLAQWHFSGRERIVLDPKVQHHHHHTAEAEAEAEAGAEHTSHPAHHVHSTIALHCGKNLNIRSVEGAVVVNRDEAKELIRFRLEPPTRTEFTVYYESEILEEMKGLYRSNYTVGGVAKRMAATHFEPMGARRMYLCQDEPAARCSFRLSVTLTKEERSLTVLSNYPVASVTDTADGGIQHVFQPIPKCPPYLTALCIGELECISSTSGAIPLRFFVSKGQNKLPRAKFPLDVATYALGLFETFFKAAFPLPKLDLVAVPDFPIGGMENWGLILLTENTLVAEGQTSLRSLKGCCELVTHEVSHNWFGNLVGIDWWEGLWLKEGFATWCGYYGTDRRHPDWMVPEDIADEIFGALETDGTRATHSVEAPIDDPSHINQVFDAISYDKGMAVVRMLQDFLGEERFGAGLAAYVAEFSFGNTTTDQLWASLEKSSGQPISAVMRGFTKQPGFPALHVNFTSGFRTVHVMQHRYATLLNMDWAKTTTDPLRWTVPLQFLSSTGETHKVMLTAEEMTFELPEAFAKGKEIAWMKVNPGHTGFFRSCYDEASFQALLRSYSTLPLVDQRGLQNDAFAFFNSGELTLDTIMAVLDVASQSDRYAVVGDYLACFDGFYDVFSGEDTAVDRLIVRRGMPNVLRLSEKLYSSAAADTESRQLRKLCLEKLVANARRFYEDEASARQNPVIQWLQKKGNGFLLEGRSELAADGDVKCAALMGSILFAEDDQAFEALWRKFLETQDDADSCRQFIRALCIAPAPHHFDFMANEVLSAKNVKVQYGGIAFDAFAQSANAARVWPLVQQRFQDVDRLWGGAVFRLESIVQSIGRTLRGESQATDFLSFFAANPLPNASQAIQRAAEGIRLRGVLNVRHAGRLASILRG